MTIDKRAANNRTTPTDPDGNAPPFEVGDIVTGGYNPEDGPWVVQFCEYDTEDGDWFTVVSHPKVPLAADPLDAFHEYYSGDSTDYHYEWERHDYGDRRLTKTGTVLTPVDVPPLTSPEDAERFLESLLEEQRNG